MKLLERLLLWIPLVSLLAAPLAWGASDSPSAPSAPERVDISSESDRQTWVGRIRAAHKAVDDARMRQDEATIGYGKARHKNKTRGDAKRQVLQERQESRDAVAEAESNLQKTMDAARGAGVPPGWIREATSGTGPANRN